MAIRLDGNLVRDREQRQLADSLAAHGRSASFGGWSRLPVSPLVTHQQEAIDDLVPRHAASVVLDDDTTPRLVQLDPNLPGVRVPSVGDDLRQHRRNVAVEVEPEMLQDVQAQLHHEGTQHEGAGLAHGLCPRKWTSMARATARASSTGTAFPIRRPMVLKCTVSQGGTNA